MRLQFSKLVRSVCLALFFFGTANASAAESKGAFTVGIHRGDLSESRSGAFSFKSDGIETEGSLSYFGIDVARLWIGKNSSAVQTPNGAFFSDKPETAAADAASGLPVPLAFLAKWSLGLGPSESDKSGWAVVSSSEKAGRRFLEMKWTSEKRNPDGPLRMTLKAESSSPSPPAQPDSLGSGTKK